MRTVLGIDAAWTSTQPSGVALAAETPEGWQLVAAAASYQRFLAMADQGLVWEPRPSGSLPQAEPLLEAAEALAGHAVDLIAIDMPLSHVPVVGRRVADDAVSRAYGGRKCGTHTPSVLRPGPISDSLRADFAECGYPLQTLEVRSRGLIDVFPHPALVELASAVERLPYKASKVRNYWPTSTITDRRVRLYRQWAAILALLETEIGGVQAALPELRHDSPGWEVKAYEDQIDAVVCAWVAICALNGRAVPLGDDQSAIWIPAPVVPAQHIQGMVHAPRRTSA
jgi:predicted RNase H-like nuclease